MKAVIGLGNAGGRHAQDRHNVGIMAIDRMAVRFGVGLDRTEHLSRVGETRVGGERVLLVRPATYMNRVGETAAALAASRGLTAEAFIAVYDDIDLPVGRLRIRRGGGAGGHRGVLSLIAHLGGAGFSRVRLGIGRPAGERDAVVDHVLSPFDAAEAALIDAALTRAVDAVEVLIVDGVERAMNLFNAAPVEPLAS
jgi:PTH1 family peptidyl-tRNA hydrolase